MGTWVEDSMNLYVADKLTGDNIKSYLFVGGVTADFYEGITEKDLLNNISILKIENSLLWETKLNESQSSTKKYIDIFLNSNPSFSIVNSSIVAAAQGIRGSYIPNFMLKRLGNNPLIITNLTSSYFIFLFLLGSMILMK